MRRFLPIFITLLACTDPTEPTPTDAAILDASVMTDQGAGGTGRQSIDLGIGGADGFGGMGNIAGASGFGGSIMDDCVIPNPQGCAEGECPEGQICDLAECLPARCLCEGGEWVCTENCGGVCVDSQPVECPEPNPQGCMAIGCPDGEYCAETARCMPTQCVCGQDGEWACTEDCEGGQCVPNNECQGPPPTDNCALDDDCPGQSRCVGEPCECECVEGDWSCPDGCGTQCQRVPQGCIDSNPQGCLETGCSEDQVCEMGDTCIPSSCDCIERDWICTPDCGGGVCVRAERR